MNDSHLDEDIDNDPYHLARFVRAQEQTYDSALSEIRSGRKNSHWMWFIFPQFTGLGSSETSRRYAIKSLREAKAYLEHPILGPRLVECFEAALRIRGRTAREIFGSPDHMKLLSSATLFAMVSPEGSVFQQLIEKYFDGQTDEMTLKLLKDSSDKPIKE